jgi:hypothetical protein
MSDIDFAGEETARLADHTSRKVTTTVCGHRRRPS